MKSKDKKARSLPRKILSVCVKIVVVLLIVLVLAVAAFAVFFWDTFVVIVKNPKLIPYVVENFETFTRGFKVSVDELELEKNANAEAQAKALEEADIKLSADDIAGLADENLTEEERAQIIYNAMTSGGKSENVEAGDSPTVESIPDIQLPDDTKQDVSEKDNSGEVNPAVTDKPVTDLPGKPEDTDKVPQSDSKPEKDNPATDKMTEDEYNIRVSELVAKVYSIKADFVSKLSAFETKIISEYKALPAEQRTAATKARIVSENMSYIMGLEAQCDAQVKAITDELTVLMTTNNKPTTLVDQINAAYANEKEIKKAYYVSLYK